MPLDWMAHDLAERRRHGLLRQRRRLQSACGAHVRLDDQELVHFGSNDYLGLAGDPRLAAAVARTARRYGVGTGASPLVAGWLPPIRTLERALAHWEGTERALVFSSGYAANLAVLSALLGPDDAVFSDALNHASLIDGCRLQRPAIYVYPHRDLERLDELLARHAARARRRVIVSDSVFSMDGTLAPLRELLHRAEQWDAVLVLDEAHATGVLGETGQGLTELHPPTPEQSQRLIKIGTLSKALGCQGGFVAASRLVVRWLVNQARPYVFSTALAVPVAGAARRAVAIARDESYRRRHLHTLAEQLRNGLRRLGADVMGETGPIVPVRIGSPRRAVEWSRRLQKAGYLVPAIRPPAVPDGSARLRLSVTAAHSLEEVNGLLEAWKRLGSSSA